MVVTTFHPAQKYPVLSHSQLDASSSQIPEPGGGKKKTGKSLLKQGSRHAADNDQLRIYVVCPKSKCTNFPMYELAM